MPQGLLSQQLGAERVLTTSLDAYQRDESDVLGAEPLAVVLAESATDIDAALAVAARTGTPIVPRAGGTGKVGGCILTQPGIVLDVSRMNHIKDIDVRQGIAVVEPGVKLAALQAAVEAEGWFYPPDPNSLEDCTLGGNVATNAAGPRAFKYGPTRDYVIGLDAHLITGDRFFCGKRTRKGVTGYDVPSLLVGSEGTLAVVSEITLKLLPKPPDTLALVVLFLGLYDAANAVAAITSSGVLPRCIELCDATTLGAMRAAGNAFNERAGAMLLIELDGDPDACLLQAERVADACTRGNALEVIVAQNAAQRDRVWQARRSMSPAIRKLTRHKISEDIVVAAPKIGELCSRIEKHAEQLKVRWLVYGHAGDGNLHANFLWNDPEEHPRIEKAVDQLFRDTVDLGGTLTGEHGIGILKAPYLELEQSAALIDLQRRIKAVFDPRCLLNPGKIFGRSGHGNC